MKATELKLDLSNIVYVQETKSGMKNYKSRELGKIDFQKGDTLICSEISRIGRTIVQIMSFLGELSQKGVAVYFTKTKFEVNDSIQSQTMIFASSICAQIEREMISVRTKDSLNKKKTEGVVLGRPKNKFVLDSKWNEIKKLLDEGMKKKVIAKKFDVCPNTLTNLIKIHKEETKKL